MKQLLMRLLVSLGAVDGRGLFAAIIIRQPMAVSGGSSISSLLIYAKNTTNFNPMTNKTWELFNMVMVSNEFHRDLLYLSSIKSSIYRISL